jgi:Na+-driven multidrug efflux pump
LADIFTGISQGIQPLISYNYGLRNRTDTKRYLRKGLITSFTLALIIYTILYFQGDHIISVFTADHKTVIQTFGELKIYAFSFLIAAINVIVINYYLYVTQTRLSIFVSFMRGIFFTVLLTIIIPYFFGASGIWISINMVEIATLLLILSLEQTRRLIKGIIIQTTTPFIFDRMRFIPTIYNIICQFKKQFPVVNDTLIRECNFPYT